MDYDKYSLVFSLFDSHKKMARAQGIEPQSSGPEPDVVPLDHARTLIPLKLIHHSLYFFAVK
jgi:hypothetical protein